MQWNRIQYCCLDGKLSLISYAFVLGYFEKRNQPELLMVTDVCQRGHFEAETQWMGCRRILRLTTARKRWLEESDCTAGDCSNRRHWLRVCKPSCQWHIGSSNHTHANLKSHVVCNHDTQSHGSTMLMRIPLNGFVSINPLQVAYWILRPPTCQSQKTCALMQGTSIPVRCPTTCLGISRYGPHGYQD